MNALFAQWNEMEQQVGESFDAYYARVNRLTELPTNAGEKPSERTSAFKLLERLQPQLKLAVLALQNSGTLKQTKKVLIPATQSTVLDVD